MKIKKGAMVKAWDNDPKKFTVGVYWGFSRGFHNVDHMGDDDGRFDNVIEIPPELAAQLEFLGVGHEG